MRIQSVCHQIEFAIWRDERNHPFTLEFVQTHTLMELNILHFNEFTASGSILHFKEDLVIQSKLELWHTAQKASHVNATKDLRSQYISIS